ncbi:MAG: 50S ribosomal protein L9 [Myxococcota bacterium]
MAKRNVQVVLKRDVDTLGVSGDIVKVRPGFARNYLIPRGMAVIASRANVKQIEHEKARGLQLLAKKKAAAEERAKAFQGLVLHVAKQVADEDTGKLFGSVTLSDIMEALDKKGFGDVDRKRVILPEDQIKQTGTYEVRIRLMKEVEVPVKLEVKTAA